MDENEQSRFDDLTDDLIDYVEGLDKNDEEYSEKVKLVCQMVDRTVEVEKIRAQIYENQTKLDNEIEIQKMKAELEKAKVEMDRRTQMEDAEIKRAQLKQDKIRTWVEFGKGLSAIGVFVLFEVLAHKRDMHDVIPTDPMHVKNNSMKLKLW